MTALRRLLLRLWNVVCSGPTERELEREMASHLALLEAEFLERGLSVEQAGAEARRRFGGRARVRDTHRDARSLVWLDDLGRDLQYAKRLLLRSPGFTPGSRDAAPVTLDHRQLSAGTACDPPRSRSRVAAAVIRACTSSGSHGPNEPDVAC